MKLDNIVPFDIALQLNKAGLVVESQKYYNIYNKFVFESVKELHNEAVWAPTYKEVISWFKKTHNLSVQPTEESILENVRKIQ